MAKKNAMKSLIDTLDPETWAEYADENGVSLMNLPPEDKDKLEKKLRKSKDFTNEEKMILYTMLGIPPTYKMVAAALGITDTAVFRAEERALQKMRDELAKKGHGLDTMDRKKMLEILSRQHWKKDIRSERERKARLAQMSQELKNR